VQHGPALPCRARGRHSLKTEERTEGPFHRRAEEPKLDSVVWRGGPSSE